MQENPEYNSKDREALEPATDQQKENIIAAIEGLLNQQEYSDFGDYRERFGNLSWRGIRRDFPDKKLRIEFMQYLNDPNSLVATISMIRWLKDRKGPFDETIYRIYKTQIDYQVKQRSFHDENIRYDSIDQIFSRTAEEERERRREAAQFEEEIGFTFFSKRDAEELLLLLEEVKHGGI